MTVKVTNTYNLKLTPSQFGQNSMVVNCSQYDSLYRVIQFNLFNGNAIYSIPEGSVVTIRGTKKDMTGFEYECDYSNNVVTFPIRDQITIYPGKVPAELRIVNDGEIIGSWNFVFLVEESPLDENTIISETDLPLLESALEAAAQAESFKILAEQSATDASTSASEASDSASTATTKAEESAESALKSEGYAVGEQNGEPVDETSIYYHNNAKWYSQSGGGGTHNYEALVNKPSINDVTLEGNKTLEELGVPLKTSELTNDSGYITSVPVDSVNGKTGTVVLNASDVGALSDATVIPTKTSELTNDSGFLTSVPVTSVNNKTGAVNLSASDVDALASNTAYVSTVNGSSGAVTISVPTNTSDLVNDSGFLTSAVTTFNGQSGAVTYSAPVSSVNGQTGAVTGLQTTSNLVTSVSSASTDAQYPSAKCLYDMVGDIETLLGAI